MKKFFTTIFSLVTRDLLKKLLANVQTVKEQYDIARHFLVAARKLKAAQASGREMPKEPLFLDPWKDVRHLQIKIPEEVLAKKKKSEQPRKRGIDIKKENVEVPVKRGLLESMAECISSLNYFVVLVPFRPLAEVCGEDAVALAGCLCGCAGKNFFARRLMGETALVPFFNGRNLFF